jgi:hypothetical protein
MFKMSAVPRKNNRKPRTSLLVSKDDELLTLPMFDDRGNYCLLRHHKWMLIHGEDHEKIEARAFLGPETPPAVPWWQTKQRRGQTKLAVMTSGKIGYTTTRKGKTVVKKATNFQGIDLKTCEFREEVNAHCHVPSKHNADEVPMDHPLRNVCCSRCYLTPCMLVAKQRFLEGKRLMYVRMHARDLPNDTAVGVRKFTHTNMRDLVFPPLFAKCFPKKYMKKNGMPSCVRHYLGSIRDGNEPLPPSDSFKNPLSFLKKLDEVCASSSEDDDPSTTNDSDSEFGDILLVDLIDGAVDKRKSSARLVDLQSNCSDEENEFVWDNDCDI